MRNFINDILHNAPKRTNPTHASLLLIIGAYICYLGIKMVLNTKSGVSSMPMNQSIILCIIMCVAGGIVIIYSLLLFYHSSKHHYYGEADDNDTDKQVSPISEATKKESISTFTHESTSDDTHNQHD